MKKITVSKNELITGIIILVFGILAAISFKSNWNYWFGSLFLLIVLITSFFKKDKTWGNKLFQIMMGIFLILSVLLSFLQYGLIDVNFLAISFLIFLGIIVLLGLASWIYLLIQSKKLFHSKDKKKIKLGYCILILAYFFIIFLVIFSFTWGYMQLDDIEYKGESLSLQEHSDFDYIYFSALTFYATGDNNFSPMKGSRILVVLEIILSFIFHIIILQSYFLNRPKK